MKETLIELGLAFVPAFFLGWIGAVSVGDAQMESEKWYMGGLRWLGGTLLCEVLGFLALRLIYRLFLLLI